MAAGGSPPGPAESASTPARSSPDSHGSTASTRSGPAASASSSARSRPFKTVTVAASNSAGSYARSRVSWSSRDARRHSGKLVASADVTASTRGAPGVAGSLIG